MGRSTRHLLALLLVAALLASTLTPRSHHVGTPQAPATAVADGTQAIKASQVDPTPGTENLSAGEQALAQMG